MEIRKYEPSLKKEWNAFIRESRNGTFLLDRDFMDYHSDRFADHSLLFYDNTKIIAVLPANIKEGTLYSHQGLTYGGIIQAEKTSIAQIREAVILLVEYLKSEKIEKLIYKPVPHIYHRYPAEEDLYALFQAGAILKNRSVSSTIYLGQRIEFNRLRKRNIKKATELGFYVSDKNLLDEFWGVLSNNLKSTHGVNPVHTVDEIKLLHSRFPEFIRIFCTLTPDNNEVVAGMVVFETPTVVHIQYCSASPYGKQNGGLDILYEHVINGIFGNDNRFFDFGISTEYEGRFLNEGLIFQKEGFGARATICDTYELSIK